MRTRSMMVLAGLLLSLTSVARGQVINGQSTAESNLRNRPSVELEDSALVPKPRPEREDDETRPDRETDRSLYPTR